MVLGFHRKTIVPVTTTSDSFTLYSKTSRLPLLRRRRISPVGIAAPMQPIGLSSGIGSGLGVGYSGLGTGVGYSGLSSGYSGLSSGYSGYSSYGYSSMAPSKFSILSYDRIFIEISWNIFEC